MTGWSGTTRIAPRSQISVTAMKGKTALAIQTGNMSRFYADLLKLQLQFVERRADSAIYVLPTKLAAKQLGDNIANYDRLVDELDIFRAIITVPIFVIGVEGD